MPYYRTRRPLFTRRSFPWSALPRPAYTTRARSSVRASYRPTVRRYLTAVRSRPFLARSRFVPYPSGNNGPMRGDPYGLEYKSFIHGVPSGSGETNNSNTFEPFLVNAMVQGSKGNERIGRDITMKRVTMTWYIRNLRNTNNSPPYLIPNQVRVGILIDLSPAGATDGVSTTWPVQDDIWTVPNTPMPLLGAIRNLNGTDRFKIIKSKIVTLNGTVHNIRNAANTAIEPLVQGVGFEKVVKLSCKLPNYKTTLADASVVIQSGVGLYGFIVTGQDAAATGAQTGPSCVYSFTSNLTYVDS